MTRPCCFSVGFSFLPVSEMSKILARFPSNKVWAYCVSSLCCTWLTCNPEETSVLSKVSLLKAGLSLHLRMTTCDLLCPIEANSERISLLNVWKNNEYKKSAWTQKTQWELLQKNILKYQIYSFNSVEIHLMFVSRALSSTGLPPKQAGGSWISNQKNPGVGMVKPSLGLAATAAWELS